MRTPERDQIGTHGGFRLGPYPPRGTVVAAVALGVGSRQRRLPVEVLHLAYKAFDLPED